MSLSGRPGNFGTRFHNFLYRELGLNFVYKAFTTQDIGAAIGGIRALGIRGCAISMPFKEACIQHLNELDPSVKGIASVNTIVNSNGYLKGYNTDYVAVRQLLVSREIPMDTSFAILGSGGMAKAVVCALKDLGFSDGQIIARNREAGSALAAKYGYTWQPDLGKERPGLIINVTPIGMMGGREEHDLPFQNDVIDSSQYVFDVVAIPLETPLLRRARELNKSVISGADVTLLQSIEQFILYTGVRPDQALIERAANFARAS